MATPSASFVPRLLCERCLRPRGVCVCAHLPDLAPRTRVLIVQHPREQRVAIGTARMAARCLRGARVVVGTALDAHPEVRRALADPAHPAILLWPGPGARDLASAPPTGPVTLVAVDGTWLHAQKLLRLNPGLAALPRYGITPTAPSDYRIRREPRAECLSTLEALSQALGLLEGDPAPYRAMLAPFRAMVDAQLEHQRRMHAPRDRSRLVTRRGRPWAPPPPLCDPAHLRLVTVESNGWPLEAKESHPDQIVHWLSVRGDGSGLVELFAAPSHPLAPSVTAHTRLAPEQLLGGLPRAAFAAAVEACAGPGDVLATWGSYARTMMAQEGLLSGRPTLDLRRVAADWLRGTPGSIERFVERAGPAAAPLGAGRGGVRLAQLLQALGLVRGPQPARAQRPGMR